MEHVDCPECLRPAKWMPVLSFIDGADDYFLCEECKQVSFRPKDANVPLTPFKLGMLPGTGPSPHAGVAESP